jgi:hypothetical protein
MLCDDSLSTPSELLAPGNANEVTIAMKGVTVNQPLSSSPAFNWTPDKERPPLPTSMCVKAGLETPHAPILP